MQIKYEWGSDETVRWSHKESPSIPSIFGKRRTYAHAALGATTLGFGLLALAFMTLSFVQWFFWFPLACLPVVMFVIVVCAWYLFTAESTWQMGMFAGQENVCTLTDEGLLVSIGGAEGCFYWPCVRRLYVNECAVCLSLSNGLVHILPRRAFAGDDELRRFVTEIERRAGLETPCVWPRV